LAYLFKGGIKRGHSLLPSCRYGLYNPEVFDKQTDQYSDYAENQEHNPLFKVIKPEGGDGHEC
jgi:hypothetical protein